MHRWRCPDAAECRRPAPIPCTQWARENDNNGVATEVERTATQHATLGDGMEVTTNDKRDAARHRGHGRHEPVVLLEPAAYSTTEGPIDWSPENLIIIRFGLNADFIDAHGLTWIDNLETSSGKQLDDPEHADHDKRYVQDYLAEFGARKCEANALVVEPEIGRQLCRDAIMEHLPANAVERYRRKLERIRRQLQKALCARVVEE
jgi:hypothetical protein